MRVALPVFVLFSLSLSYPQPSSFILLFTSLIPLLFLSSSLLLSLILFSCSLLSLPSLLSCLLSLSLITHFTKSSILLILFPRLALHPFESRRAPTIATVNYPSFEAVLAQQVPVLLKDNPSSILILYSVQWSDGSNWTTLRKTHINSLLPLATLISSTFELQYRQKSGR